MALLHYSKFTHIKSVLGVFLYASEIQALPKRREDVLVGCDQVYARGRVSIKRLWENLM